MLTEKSPMVTNIVAAMVNADRVLIRWLDVLCLVLVLLSAQLIALTNHALHQQPETLCWVGASRGGKRRLVEMML